jgi:hypothetical protein
MGGMCHGARGKEISKTLKEPEDGQVEKYIMSVEESYILKK